MGLCDMGFKTWPGITMYSTCNTLNTTQIVMNKIENKTKTNSVDVSFSEKMF